MFQKISYRENQDTQFIFNTFSPENRAVYEIMWKNMVEPDASQLTKKKGGEALALCMLDN